MTKKDPVVQEVSHEVKPVEPSKSIVVRKNLLPLVIGGFALLALAAVPGYYFYNQYQHTQLLLQNPTAAAKEETENLLKRVGKLIVLPQNEHPTIATVTDTMKLKNQPFFQNAQNGDKVLLYTDAKKAIIYRPSVNKIVEVGPINVQGNVAGAETTTVYKVAIYNGTLTSGLASTFEKQLKSTIKNVEIVLKGNAQKKDYTKTLIIDLKGTNKEAVIQFSQALHAEVAQLPAGEDKPNADILIIVGQ